MAKDLTDAWTREADSIALQRIDEAAAVPRPNTINTTYVEREYAALGEEQELLHAAEGEAQARAHQLRAAALKPAADEDGFLLKQSQKVVEAAHEHYQHAVRVLAVYARRDRFAVYRYLFAWIILGLGDTAGVLGAAILLGEIPWIALGQALATGFAAITSGQAGADLKDLRMSRQRQRELKELTEDERRYQQLFTGMETGVSIMRLVGWLSTTIVLIISIGIFSLRYSVEGLVAGVAFGTLAAATAIGSFITVYSYTDDIADLLATTERRYRRAVTEHRSLARASTARHAAEAAEAGRSTTVEHQLRGLAASERVRALCQRVLRRHPQVVGHGPAAGDHEGVIGRRIRRSSAA